MTMADREKVIKEFEAFVNGNCPSDSKHVCHIELMETVLALLKEQKAVEPQLSMSGLWYECPVCHRHLLKNRDNYCARCGKAVKWNERDRKGSV